MKLLITALAILGVVYGVYHFTMAAYGWFQMAGVLDDVASNEIPRIVQAAQHQQSGFPDRGDRFVKVREGIMKGAQEAKVPLRADDVAVSIVDNMLDVRLAWDAPIVVYNGKPYLEVPMSLQRAYTLRKPAPMR